VNESAGDERLVTVAVIVAVVVVVAMVDMVVAFCVTLGVRSGGGDFQQNLRSFAWIRDVGL
jgi:hypothetical protein